MYLTNRTQRAVVNGSRVCVSSGVPHGSLFGPNDLCNITLSRGSKMTMHADNVVL